MCIKSDHILAFSFSVQIIWHPYEGDSMDQQPWVSEGQGLFNCDIFLHAFSFVEPLYVRLIMRTLGYHQANVDVTSLSQRQRSSQRYVGVYETDWAVEHDEEGMDWHSGGPRVMPTATSSEEYLQNYRRRYRDRLQLGRVDVSISSVATLICFNLRFLCLKPG